MPFYFWKEIKHTMLTTKAYKPSSIEFMDRQKKKHIIRNSQRVSHHPWP